MQSKTQNPHYTVVAAVLSRTINGKTQIFCAKRPGPKPGKAQNETHYKWEFPGGKIENGENQQQAIEREILEEFGAKIHADTFLTTVEHQYKDFSITMHAWNCTLLTGNLELKEHLESDWVELKDLLKKDWAAADVPIATMIAKNNT